MKIFQSKEMKMLSKVKGHISVKELYSLLLTF